MTHGSGSTPASGPRQDVRPPAPVPPGPLPPSPGPHGRPPHGQFPSGPVPPGAYRADPEPAPESVRTAAQLWWVIVALGVVRVIASAIDALTHRDEVERVLIEAGQQIPEAGAHLYVSMYVVFLVMGGLVLAAAAAGVTHLFAKGRAWARTVLTVGAIWLVIGALTALFALGGTGGAAAFAAGAVAVVQGVLAGGALYAGYRPEANGYFFVTRK